jgi:hypothetical protein
MKDQVQLLIDILLDKTAEEAERGDAAIDLRAYKDIRALETLTAIASDPVEDDVVVANYAESSRSSPQAGYARCLFEAAEAFFAALFEENF